jgi:hypothetical protein
VKLFTAIQNEFRKLVLSDPDQVRHPKEPWIVKIIRKYRKTSGEKQAITSELHTPKIGIHENPFDTISAISQPTGYLTWTARK